jgi:hypothetical protein
MKRVESHIIQRQSIEINFEEMEAGVEMQQRIADLFYERLEPAMNKLFDDFVGDERSATIDRLEIDCGNLSAGHWEEDLVQQVTRKLSDQLRQIDKKALDRNARAKDMLIFFLKNGLLPWNNCSFSMQDLEELVRIDQSFVQRIVDIVGVNSLSRKRLLYQFSQNFKLKLVVKMVESASRNYLAAEQIRTAELEGVGEAIINDLLLSLIDHSESRETTGTNMTGKVSTPAQQEVVPDSPEELYINNAGVVLLHPFLPMLFDTLGLTNNDQWVDEELRPTAILITQHLVTGEQVFPEYEIPLNKILCSYPLAQPIDKKIEIDDFIRTECDGLLTEAIRQWARLKSTGIDTFRETFLQRMGKLSKIANGWLLQVDQKPVDILLGGLPWGIGVIKLPWMKEILYVEWT